MSESEEVRRHRDENMGGKVDDQPIVRGWSIDIGQLKKAIANMPDDYELMVTCSEVDDCDIAETHIDSLYLPALGSPGLLILSTGQTVSSEYAFHARMDAYHQSNRGVKHWSEEKQEWGDTIWG